jgi:hypothetical protein
LPWATPVILRDHPVPLDSDVGRDLIVDCARYAEGLQTEDDIKKKYRFSDEDWEHFGANDALVAAIKVEKTRRIRDGTSARERAQVLFAQTPEVLGSILHGDGVSPRHKIESAREIRAIAATGPETTPAADRFIITINLGTDVEGKPVIEHYNKSIAICPDDVDPDHVDAPSQGVLAAIAAKNKPGDGGNGEPV